jgi:hypothetical protein
MARLILWPDLPPRKSCLHPKVCIYLHVKGMLLFLDFNQSRKKSTNVNENTFFFKLFSSSVVPYLHIDKVNLIGVWCLLGEEGIHVLGYKCNHVYHY